MPRRRDGSLGAPPGRVTSSRLYAMVRSRGYPGGADHFRHLMLHYRPRVQPQAYLRLKTLPGEHDGRDAEGRATQEQLPKHRSTGPTSESAPSGGPSAP